MSRSAFKFLFFKVSSYSNTPLILVLIVFSLLSPISAVQLLEEKKITNQHYITARLSIISALKNVLILSGSWTAFRPFELNVGYLNARNGLEIFSESYRKGFYFNGGAAIPWRSAFYTESNNNQREIIITAGYFRVQTLKRSLSYGGEPIPDAIAGESHAFSLLTGLEITRWITPVLGLQIHTHLGAYYYVSGDRRRRMEPALEVSAGIAL